MPIASERARLAGFGFKVDEAPRRFTFVSVQYRLKDACEARPVTP